MGLFKEFRDFILRGNAIDLAVGIIIGAAFGAVVNSLVKDVVMPPIGYVMGGIDFSDKQIVLQEALPKGTLHPVTGLALAKDMPAVTLNWGMFINACIALTIQGFAIFLVVKGMNSLRKKEAAKPAPPPGPTPDQKLLAEIRDLLRQQKA